MTKVERFKLINKEEAILEHEHVIKRLELELEELKLDIRHIQMLLDFSRGNRNSKKLEKSKENLKNSILVCLFSIDKYKDQKLVSYPHGLYVYE